MKYSDPTAMANTATETAKVRIRNRIANPGQGDHAIELGQNLKFLGFDRESFLAWEQIKNTEALKKSGGLDEAGIGQQIAARNAARKAKDFKEADRIRDELLAKGVVLKDSKDGTTWEIAR